MKIGITQRVDKVIDYNEIRDGLDQNWIHLLNIVGLDVIPIPNQIKNVKEFYLNLGIEGIILTGGNDLYELKTNNNVSLERDNVEKVLFEVAKDLGHPILGVCRGMQHICMILGERIVKINSHVSKRHNLRIKGLIEYPMNYEVNSFHNWGLKKLKPSTDLIVLAYTSDGSIEAVRHKNKRIFGIMWHPEREQKFSEFDIQFIKHIFLND